MYPTCLSKACIVCLSTDCKLYSINVGALLYEYCETAGCNAGDLEGMPQYLCVECTGYVKRFKKFREKCRTAHTALRGLLQCSIPVTESVIKSIDRNKNKIGPYLSTLNLQNVSYEVINYPETFSHSYKPYCVDNDNSLPVFFWSTELNEPVFEVTRTKPSLALCNEIKVELVDGLDIDMHTDANKEPEFQFDVPMVQSDEKLLVEQLKANDDYESDSYIENDDDDNLENDDFDEDTKADEKNIELSTDQEYANVIPITVKEAKAVTAVNTMYNFCSLRCKTCGKGFQTDARLKNHERIHDQHTSGTYKCEVCHACYKTQLVLDSHLNEKHLFKYICKKCPEVNYDRVTAKQHFIRMHMWGQYRCRDRNWNKNRPAWLSMKGVIRKVKKEKRKESKPPNDYPKLIPVRQEDQYRLVNEKKHSKNYTESRFKCDLCYKGFLTTITFQKHLKVHDPAISGKHQCDMCKMCFKDQRKIYAHIRKTHLLKYACQMCDYVCSSGNQARLHYHEHKNVVYTCQHCNEEFKKNSTLLTHIRVKHPSMNMCLVCGHSFVSEYGIHVHMNKAHSPQEIAESKSLKPDPGHPNYCAECKLQFLTAGAYVTHLGSSNKHSVINVSSKPDRKGVRLVEGGRRRKRGRPKSEILNMGVRTATTCDVCGAVFPNDREARRHYESEHPGTQFLKRYMCDVCGHTTKLHANLVNHMRVHTKEKPFACPHCDKRFTNQSNRDTHIVVHTGERRHECQHCGKRFSRASCVRLHIQTVHLKIPYPPWDKKNRRRRKELENAALPYSDE